ncbi:MAG: NAD(P)/FAD-dependent oxidoreductase [Candidatus Omnitrophica bacterium]|nr:NAD(P)/FAD-dependent oxidoreductase [Candidatus Omnitrophota bacterium]
MSLKRIVVVGAGPAGMMAAIRSAQLKQDVVLIEKNPHPGRKLLLSGKGRCNLTNTCDLDPFLKNFGRNGQFLRNAFQKFSPQDLMHFFESRGLRLKTERQGRVFPADKRSETVLKILEEQLHNNKVRILFNNTVRDILIRDASVRAVILADGKIISADRIILATGGTSYSFTGSDGQMIKLSQRLGHRIVELRPGLVPLQTFPRYPSLRGLILKNIRVIFSNDSKRIVSDIGELTFTKFGVGGALVLSLSGQIFDWLSLNKTVYLEIDLKPGLSIEQLHARLLREFRLNAKKTIRSILKSLLPKRLIDVFIKTADINPEKKGSQITYSERSRMASLFKRWHLNIVRARPIEEAMITRGGISLKDINPRTMESRIIRGLYFAGEMIDVDAGSGGFNLQAAFSTGYLAGESAALS